MSLRDELARGSAIGTPPVLLPRRLSRDDLPATPLGSEDQIIEHPLPQIGGAGTVPVGTTRAPFSTRMRIAALEIDVASSVELDVLKDGSLWFQSAGNEAGVRRFVDRDTRPRVNASIEFVWINNSGGTARARAAVIGPPEV